MEHYVFDMETDGLQKEVTKMHCLSYQCVKTGKITSITSQKEVEEFFSREAVFIAHNPIRYDFPVLKKLFNIPQPKNIIDTLGISWYLYCDMDKHGLGPWGKRLGILKPTVEDWSNLSLEEYIHRCEEDVKINVKLWVHFESYLNVLYDNNYFDVINYINNKLFNLRDREEEGIYLDDKLCVETLIEVEDEIDKRMANLESYMPKIEDKVQPKLMYKKDGSLSARGLAWQELLESKNLPKDSKVIYKSGNPGSSAQIKSWLFSLGWEPETFNTNDKNEQVPQISLPFGAGLCPSIKTMFEDNPELEDLDGLYMLKHRKGLLKGFLECVDDEGKIYASCHGFTNTFRLRHIKPIVNLVGVDKPYGKQIRGCLSVKDKENYEMCGWDVSSLEDSTKQHFMFFFDPEYVTNMRVPGFDPHIDIAVFANLMTVEEGEKFKVLDGILESGEHLSEEDMVVYKTLKKKRANAKTINFAGVYGVGPPKLAKTLKISLEEAQTLHTAYWERNKAVKQVADAVEIKTVNNKLWLYNPISKFWYSLRDEKDSFSTLNQGRICSV